MMIFLDQAVRALRFERKRFLREPLAWLCPERLLPGLPFVPPRLRGPRDVLPPSPFPLCPDVSFRGPWLPPRA